MMHWRGNDPADGVFLSQRDVRELQFAKASIATGWQILLGELGAKPEDVAQVLLAGSFGATSRRRARSASAWCRGWRCRGSCRRQRRGGGREDRRASHRERAEAYAIVREVRYVELSGRTDFNDRFIDQLAFPG